MFLSIGTSPITVGETGAYTLIAEVQTSTGYDIAVADVGTGTFVSWTTDQSGHFSVSSGLTPIASNIGSNSAIDWLQVGGENMLAL